MDITDDLWELPFSCGLCKRDLSWFDKKDHGCFRFHSEIYTDCFGFVYPKIDDDTLLSTITINEEKQQFHTSISEKSLNANKDPFPTIQELLLSKKPSSDETISVNAEGERKSVDGVSGQMLANLIRERPELWNICLPVQKRSENLVTNSWKEVAEAMGVDEKEVKKQWETWIDYRRTLKKNTPKSGSAETSREAWPMMKVLSFLDRTDLDNRATTSNMEEMTQNESHSYDVEQSTEGSISEGMDCSTVEEELVQFKSSRSHENSFENSQTLAAAKELAGAINVSAPQFTDFSNHIRPPLPELSEKTELEAAVNIWLMKLKSIDDKQIVRTLICEISNMIDNKLNEL